MELKVEHLSKVIDYKLAYNAYSGTSFSPEERAKNIQEGFAKEIMNFYTKLVNVDDSRVEEMKDDMQWLIEGYKKRYIAYLQAKSRVVSPMITGPANFPKARNEKAMNVEMKRLNELSEWIKKYKNKLIKKYTKKEKISIEKLFVEFYKTIELRCYDVQLMKQGLERKLLKLAKEGEIKEVIEAVNANPEVFTIRHGIHNKLKKMEEKKTETWIIEEIEIIDNVEDDRIQLVFPYKPEKEIITYLKSKAWRWSPKRQCWQNYRKDQRLREIKEYIEKIS